MNLCSNKSLFAVSYEEAWPNGYGHAILYMGWSRISESQWGGGEGEREGSICV